MRLINLSETRDNIRAIKPFENKLAALESRLEKAKTNVEDLLQKYEEEHLDVQQMQKESFSSFVLRFFGKYERKLLKEEQQQIEAKAIYDKASADLEQIMHEKQELGTRLNDLRQQAREYEAELENRRVVVRKLEGDATQRYNQFEEAIDAITMQITEINEALRAASCVKSTAEEAMNSLDSAESWATYDIWARGGILSHAAKYSHIDDAEACFNTLSSQIESLRSELVDVQGLNTSSFTEISSIQRTIDFWFDNIFTDLSVRSQIQDNMEQLRSLLGNIDTVETLLSGKKQDLTLELDKNKRGQEDLLVSL